MKRVKHHLHLLIRVFKHSLTESADDNIMKLAAALAYYTVFSLVPMLIIILWVTGIFYNINDVQGELMGHLHRMLGGEAARQIQEVMIHSKLDKSSAWAKMLGLVTLMLSATGIFLEIQDSINKIWGLQVKPTKGIRRMLVNRLLSFSLLLSLGFILVVSLVINALLSTLTIKLQYYYPAMPVFLFYMLNQGLILLITSFLFACIFKVLPDAKISWRDVAVSAIITAILFMLGKFGIGYYLEKNATVTAFGSAGSVIVILIWVYFSSIILYFGAECTQAYLKLNKTHVEPNRYAVWVEKKVEVVDSNTEIKNKEAIGK